MLYNAADHLLTQMRGSSAGSCKMAPDGSVVQQFLEGKLVVDIVCISGLPYRHSVDCKTTPPSRETIQLLDEVVAHHGYQS